MPSSSLRNWYVEAPTPKVTPFVDGNFLGYLRLNEVIKVMGSDPVGLASLWKEMPESFHCKLQAVRTH